MSQARSPGPATLLSDEPTVELIIKARGGDAAALDAILQRCLPSLTRWAHGRLPLSARGHLDTGDLVQDAVLSIITKLDTFQPRHVGAMQAYLRRSVINRIRDEVRRVRRRQGAGADLLDEIASDAESPLERAIASEAYDRYRDALKRLRSKDRELVVARIEAQWTTQEIAERFGFTNTDAARMAVNRAVGRLTTQLSGRA